MRSENSFGVLELEKYFGIKDQSKKVLKINLDENPMTEKEIIAFLATGDVPERLKYLFHVDKLLAKDGS